VEGIGIGRKKKPIGILLILDLLLWKSGRMVGIKLGMKEGLKIIEEGVEGGEGEIEGVMLGMVHLEKQRRKGNWM